MDRFCTGGARRDYRPLVASFWFNAICVWAVIVSFVMETMVVSLYAVGRSIYLDGGDGNLVGLTAFTVVDILLSTIFIMEMAFRILAIGWKGYWSSPWWRLDGVIAITTTVVVIVRLCVSLFSKNGLGTILIMFASALRGVRIIKFMVTIPSVKVILETVAKVTRQSSHFMVVLLTLYYYFSIIGMHMVSMKLEQSNPYLANTSWYSISYRPSVPHTLNTTAAAAVQPVHGYAEMVNFSNFLSSMFTLIHVTFLNNWHVTCEAVMEAVAGGMPNGNLRTTVQIIVFLYFVLIFVLGWGLVMNVFISKFLDNYVYAKHAEDAKNNRRRLTTLTWTIGDEGVGVNITRMDPDKQLVLDGLRAVFPTMHIGRDRPVSGASMWGGEMQVVDNSTGTQAKIGCIICAHEESVLANLRRCRQCRLMYRCELCLSPVCGKADCSTPVIAPKLVLEVDRGVRKLGSADSFFGAHFHGDHIWEPVRLCNHCRSDWQGDIDCDTEIFRDAELLHADNEHLADEVLGRNMESTPRPRTSESVGFSAGVLGTSSTPRSDVGAGKSGASAKRRSKRRSSILGLLAK